MTAPIILASSVLAIVLVVALIREFRLRRALQKLLSKLLYVWRNQHAENLSSTSTHLDNSSHADSKRL